MTDVFRRPSELLILIELVGDIDIANAAKLGDCLGQAMELTGGGRRHDCSSPTRISGP